MGSLRQKAMKLLTAICRKGDNLVLEEKKFYSIKYSRIMTKYIVRRQSPGQPRETLIETYNAVELVKQLAAIYAAISEVQDGT